MDFKDIIGHELPVDLLKKSFSKGTVSHSYLFYGEEGIGKKIVAYAFSKLLLCEGEGAKPCNVCSSCRKIESNNHPDLFLIEPEGNMIKKEKIERMISEIPISPFQSKRKIFIIDDAHKMNIQSKNTLLKTLEEPPGYINIILVSSNPKSLLPTILSRVQAIKFYPVEYERVIGILQGDYGKNPFEAKFIADFTKGAIGKSIDLAKDGDFFSKRETLLDIVDKLLEGDRIWAFNSFSFFEENKEDIGDLLDILLFWFRDLMLYGELANLDLVINRDKENKLIKQSAINCDRINDIIFNIEDTKFNINRNINYQLAIENMLLNI